LSVKSATVGAEPGACSVLVASVSSRVPLQRNGNGESGSVEPGSAQGPDAVMVSGLLVRLAAVPDHQHAAWVDHPLAAVLALCAAAVVAGMRSFTAIPSWVGDVPAELLACAYSGAGGQVPARGPSKSTIWRVLTGLDGEALDAAIGDWLMHQAYPASALRGGRCICSPR
jgi:DDE_Tnp_1-associated